MSKKFTHILVLAVLLAALFVVPTMAQEDLSGETVTVFGAFTDASEVDAANSIFDAVEEETGVEVVYEGASDFEILINTRIEAGDPPDIACFPQPGLMNRFAEDALDITELLGEEYLLERYDPSWIDMATATDGSGKVIGLWMRIVVKSLVWYNPQMFADFGYEIPTTWDEMIALSDQIVADGGVPWSVAMESGPATGWVGTDMVEDIMLRTTSLENYDLWTVPPSLEERLLFESPEVRRAFELFGDIALTEGYVLGGSDRMLNTSFFDSGVPLVEETAFMNKMGSFMPPWIDPESYDVNVAEDGNLWYFAFPPIDEEYGNPVLVSGDVCSAYNDTPAVRAVLRAIAEASNYETAIGDGVFYIPHLNAQIEWFPPANAGIAEILANASAFRFDGGDLQPADVGAGSFWQGIVDYVGGDDLDSILPEIDAAWPEE
jgi:alpha-glucoside transport system substrate-binding protein